MINDYCNIIPDKKIIIEYMFYDGY